MTLRPEVNLHVLATTRQLGEEAATMVADLSAQATANRNHFTVALSGGSLTKTLGRALVAQPFRDRIDWSAWHVFWADERCVPLDHPDSSYRLAREHLVDFVEIPPNQIHTLDDSLEPAPAATLYQTVLAQVFKPPAGHLPRFDLILLGMGQDGHTASLFPNHRLLQEANRWVAPIFDSPKPPSERITLTLPVINNARQVVFITAGESKASSLAQVLKAETPPENRPARMVRPTNGELHWFVDEDAASQLEE